jgi:hypothetical protein
MTLEFSFPKEIWLVTLAGIFVMTACISSNIPTTLAVSPTPILKRVEYFTIGFSQIPNNMYLFVEDYYSDECSEQCNCPVVEPPKRIYELTSAGELCMDEHIYKQLFPDEGSNSSSGSFLGLFGYGRWREGLSAIYTLPFNYYDIIIHSVGPDGIIVIGLQGEEYFLKPGESWFNSGSYKREPPAGCIKSYSERITNYGLLDRQQIKPWPCQ